MRIFMFVDKEGNDAKSVYKIIEYGIRSLTKAQVPQPLRWIVN